MFTLTVNVTQEDIDKGYRRNDRLCPIANAVSRQLAMTMESYVRGYLIIITPDGSKLHWYLPDSAVDFISIFDSKGAEYVRPFTFEAVWYDASSTCECFACKDLGYFNNESN